MSPRATLSAVVLIVTVNTTGGALLAAQAKHDVCTVKQHECGQMAKISRCCCGDPGDGSNQGGPIESRVQLTPDVSPVPVALVIAHPDDLPGPGARVHTPRVCPPDFSILFASLLI